VHKTALAGRVPTIRQYFHGRIAKPDGIGRKRRGLDPVVAQGWDIFRDHFNTPAFLNLLPDVPLLAGLDLGSGEGHNTRLLAERCAALYAIDIASTLVKHARESGGGISYAVASAQRLPFRNAAFDFLTAFMSLMDMRQPERALEEA